MAMAEKGLPTKDPGTSPSKPCRPPGLGGSGLRGALTAGTYNGQPIVSLHPPTGPSFPGLGTDH